MAKKQAATRFAAGATGEALKDDWDAERDEAYLDTDYDVAVAGHDPRSMRQPKLDPTSASARDIEGGYENADVETRLPRDADAPGYMLDDDALSDNATGVIVENISETTLAENHTPASSGMYRG